METKNLEVYRNNLRHSAAHLLAEAVLKLYPNAKITLGPPITDGFYYDFDIDTTFSPQDLIAIEREMKRSVKRNSKFECNELSRAEALEVYKDNPYKIEIINSMSEEEIITEYSHSDGKFKDLCRGGHIEKTGEIKALKLLSTAGAYWRGDENNKMLQRIYGTAWESEELQKDYLDKRQKAIESDHRKLGTSLDLFFLDPISPANPFFLPNGAFIYNKLIEFVRNLYDKYGYQEVITPQLFSTDLWKTSGHYDFYLDNMYMMEIDENEVGVKPMNCPAHAVIYKSTLRSYRDLPLRLADFGRLHRYERSGVTHGLTRVRSFSQDDAHIFCSTKDAGIEIKSFLEMLRESYSAFGFDKPRMTLSLRPEKRAGSDEMWDIAEEQLRTVIREFDSNFEEVEGEGAFYGPKIDIFIPDVMGREWQLGTAQMDFSLPERFNLDFINSDGEKERPVVIHRAMLGSIERFIGILLEHTGGDLPFWLAPKQVNIIPISDKHQDYSEDLLNNLTGHGYRAHLDNTNERLGQKIRNSEMKKIPVMIIVGDKEIESDTVSVRTRSLGDLGSLSKDELIEKLISL
ncbi:MAG: threonine--tRNA ligase [SAR202 cluster bacterium]|nr:threonine--tRNA ligase [Chloroflexota bacterium]MQG23786.1 threonine--tRNA ligase [SAR202 cluster bacterium]MQG43054.1 threonine--tRNA ligase [SAR202 cluster bacterium]|tara:strand:- start:4580 stop:6298 length:1719 start_codon:yes stop_codon:yes gene_type:complete